MANLHVELPLQNECSSPVKVRLEPIPEWYMLQPGQQVVIHGICNANTCNTAFTVAPGDSALTIYAPGEIAGYLDCYMTCNGIRLMPDGN